MASKLNFDDYDINFRVFLKDIPIPAYVWKIMSKNLILIDYNNEALKFSKGIITKLIGKRANEIYETNPKILNLLMKTTRNKKRSNFIGKYNSIEHLNDVNLEIVFDFEDPGLIIQYFFPNFVSNTDYYNDQHSNPAVKQGGLRQQTTPESIIKTAPIGIGLVVNQNLVQVNDKLCDLLGYAREELINHNVRLIYPTEEDFEYIEKEKYKQISKSGTDTVETRFKRKDGEILDVLLDFSLLNIEDMSLGVFFAAFNITERKSTETELKNRESRFREFVDLLPLAVCETDILGNMKFVNRKGYELFGYSTDEQIGKFNAIELIVPSDREKARKNLAKNIRGEKFAGVEYIVQRKDGSTFPALVYSSPIIIDSKPAGLRVVLTDITKRKKVELNLKDSKEKYRILSEYSDDLITLYDEKYNVEYINAETHSRILGYPSNKFLKTSFKNIIVHKSDALSFINTIKKGIPVGSYRDQIRFKHKEGHYLWFQITGKLFNDALGRKKLLVVARDITDIKQYEKDLRESEEKYRFLTENSDDFITLYNEKMIIEYVNAETHSRVLGYPAIKFSKTSFKSRITHKDDVSLFLENYRKGLVNGSYRCQIRFRHKEGHYLWFQVYAKFFGDATENRKLLITSRNITDMKLAEKYLMESEEKFRTIAEQAFMGILIVQNEKIKYVNQALLEIFELPFIITEDLSQTDIIELVHPNDLELFRAHKQNLREGIPGTKYYYSYRVFTKSGKLVWLDQASKIIQYQGEPAEFITIIDITEKKEAEQELIKLNNLKSELFVRTSHELKTPLVSIRGFSDLLLTIHRSKLDDFAISKIAAIKNGAIRLQKLIGDILKAAELESGYTELKTKKNNLTQLIEACVREVQGFADLRNHRLEVDISPGIITKFEQEQIHKVISNLLNNAIKYTPPNGKIRINSEVSDKYIIISIIDNGIGFTSEEKHLIFEQFGKIERYGQNLEVITDGTGLGLFISKKIVELHGGKIWVESDGRNKGSIFSFSLPVIKDNLEK